MSCIEKSLSSSFIELPSFPTQKESNLGVVEYVSVRKSISDANHSRGHYQRFSDEDRFAIGKYAAVHGPMATVKKFKPKFPHFIESTVGTSRDKYRNTLKRSRRSSSPVKKLATITRSRSLLSGKLDEKVKNFLLALRGKGDDVNTVVAIAAAKALIQKSNEDHFKVTESEKSSWAKSLFQRMGFTKRAATTGRTEIPEGARKEVALIFHHEIVSKVEKYEIPHSLILNIDQTPSKLAPTSRNCRTCFKHI